MTVRHGRLSPAPSAPTCAERGQGVSSGDTALRRSLPRGWSVAGALPVPGRCWGSGRLSQQSSAGVKTCGRRRPRPAAPRGGPARRPRSSPPHLGERSRADPPLPPAGQAQGAPLLTPRSAPRLRVPPGCCRRSAAMRAPLAAQPRLRQPRSRPRGQSRAGGAGPPLF